jgi:hypothetical protein
MRLIAPPGAPAWLDGVLRRIRQAVGEPWDTPLRLQSIPTASLPTAADYPGGIVYDETTAEVKRSNGTAWASVGGSGSLTGLAGAIGPTIADYFSTTISLDASSTYEIECVAYLLKTTAGTLTWTWAFSSAPTTSGSLLTYTPVTGFTTTTITDAPVNAQAHVNAQTTMAHAATASLTSAVNHTFRFRVHVRTNAATTIQLRATQSAGTITPQTGSYMRATKII